MSTILVELDENVVLCTAAQSNGAAILPWRVISPIDDHRSTVDINSDTIVGAGANCVLL